MMPPTKFKTAPVGKSGNVEKSFAESQRLGAGISVSL